MIRHFSRSERPPRRQTPRPRPSSGREETREETRREEQDESGAEGPDRGERDETRVTSGHTARDQAGRRGPTHRTHDSARINHHKNPTGLKGGSRSRARRAQPSSCLPPSKHELDPRLASLSREVSAARPHQARGGRRDQTQPERCHTPFRSLGRTGHEAPIALPRRHL